MNTKYETLHSHTKNSDGKLTHIELLKVCEKNYIETVAFTDHDALLSVKTLNLLKKNNDRIDWISGIEVSSGWPKDLGGGSTSGLHVVGLFIDPTNKNLIEHCEKASSARVIRMQKMVRNLRSIGFKITERDCLKASNGESVGRPHIVEALNYYTENKNNIELIKQKMKLDSVKDMDLKEKYNYMIERGESQYPYMLFLSEDSYLKNIYVDYQYYSDLDNTVKLIRNAGGVSILAHWGTCRNKLNDEFLDKLFKENRLDGAEATYGLWNYRTANWPNQEEELKIIDSIIMKNKKLRSGGADAHTVEDIEEFSREKWFSEKTVGMAETIINNSNIDKTWSSFV